MARSAGGRDDIRQKIVLEGGDLVKRQLAELGRSGEEAIRQIDRAVNSANLTGFERAITGIGASIQRTFSGAPAALQPLHDRIQLIGRRFDDLGNSMQRVFPHFRTLAAFGVGGGLVALVAGINKANDSVDNLVDTSANLGLTVEQLQALRLMGRQTGSEVEAFSRAIARFNVATADAALKSKDFEVQTSGTAEVVRGGAKALGELNEGLDTNILRGATKGVTDLSDSYKILRLNATAMAALDPFTRLTRVVPELLKLKDAALRNKVAMDLFGRGFQELLPILEDGTKGMRAAEKAIRDLGLAPTALEKQWSAAFLKARGTMQSAFEGAFDAVGTRLGASLIPLMDAVTTFIQQNIGVWREWATQVADVVRPGMVEIGQLINGALSPKDVQTQWVRNLVTLFEDLRQAALIVGGVITGLIEILDKVALGINSLFGLEGDKAISGRAILIAAVVLQLTGVFGLLAAAVSLCVTTVSALALLFSPVGLIVGIVAVGVALLLMNDNWKNITGTASAFLSMVQAIGRYLATGFISAINLAIGALTKLIDKLRERAGVGGSGVVAEAAIPPAGLASGGRVRGPGTGTSDSILARLSNGEFVMKAAATRVFLPLLEAMNRFPGFARGGLVNAMGGGSFRQLQSKGQPGLSGLLAGGRTRDRPVSGRVAIDLTMPGGQRFDVVADASVARKMLTYARTKQATSLGRAPSWDNG